MRLQIPGTRFEVVGHRPGAVAAAPNPDESSTGPARPPPLRNFLPFKVRTRAEQVIRGLPLPSHSPQSAVSPDHEPVSASASAAQVLTSELEALQQWEHGGPPAESRQRRLTAEKFRHVLEDPSAVTLSLLENTHQLTSLPSLPAELIRFELWDGASLIESPSLARCANLQQLRLADCKKLATLDLSKSEKLLVLKLRNWPALHAMPDLSPCTNLKKLDVQFCENLSTTSNLSACTELTSVNFEACRRLTAFPDFSCNTKLTSFIARECTAVELAPDVTHCPHLTLLMLKDCVRIRAISDLSCSHELERLFIAGCSGVTAAPDWSRCHALNDIGLDFCQGISSLPSVGHLTGLRWLDARGCPLTSLPEDIQHLPSTCRVDIDAQHLSDAVVNRLQASVNAPGYQGPRIDYSMGERTQVNTAVLTDEVGAWRSEGTAAVLHNVGEAPAPNWNAFIDEPNANAFALFLARIRETSDYTQQAVPLGANRSPQQQMQQRIKKLIGQLETDSELRGGCFNLASDAVDTCGDRVALRLLDMETLCLDRHIQRDVTEGKFDTDPRQLLALCKGQYRLQILADLATEKVKTLHFCDEIEVRLGFIVPFARKYKLPVAIDSMLYPRCTNLTPNDLALAESCIANQSDNVDMQQENERKYAQFLTSSPALRALLRRQYPDAMQSAQKAIDASLSPVNARRYDALESLDATAVDYREQANRLSREHDAACSLIRHNAIHPLLHQLAATHAMDIQLFAD